MSESSSNPAIADAVARAKAIAAQLGSTAGTSAAETSTASASGASAAPAGDQQAGGSDGADINSLKRANPAIGDYAGGKHQKKIYVPTESSDINYMSLIVGPGGRHQKRVEEQTGCRIQMRGKGTERSGDPPAEDDMHVLLVAESEEALKAADEVIGKIVNDPEHAANLKRQQLRSLAVVTDESGQEVELQSDRIEIPHESVGTIIGRGGEKVREIQDRTGCRVQVQRENEVEPGQNGRRVHFTGTREQVESAKAIIETAVATRTEPFAMTGDAPRGGGMGGSGEVTMEVPDDSAGLIIGRGGSTIKAIQSQTGAHVDVPQRDPSGPNTRLVRITGPTQESVEAAKREIDNLITAKQQGGHYAVSGGMGGGYGAYGPQGGGGYGGGGYGGGAAYGGGGGAAYGGGGGGYGMGAQPGQTVVHFPVPVEMVGGLIGRGGANVKDLQQRTGCHVNIPSDPDPSTVPPSRIISLTGSAAAVEACKMEIELLVAHYRSGRGEWYGYQTLVQYHQGMLPYPPQVPYGSMPQVTYVTGRPPADQQLVYGQPPPLVLEDQQAGAAGGAPAAGYDHQQQQQPAAQAQGGQQPAATSEEETKRQWDEYYRQYYEYYGQYPPEYYQQYGQQGQQAGGEAQPAAEGAAAPPADGAAQAS